MKTRTVNIDEGARPDTTVEGLSKLKRCSPRGSVTAGNSSQTSDGGRVDLASEAAGQALWPHAAGAFVSYASRGAAATSWASARSRRSPPRWATPVAPDDIDWFELNEALPRSRWR